MREITLRQRMRYWFDNSLSGGTAPLIGWLALISSVIVLTGAFVVWLFGLLPEEQQEGGFFESAWQSFLHAIDAGTVAGDEDWWLRIVMVLVTIGGIFIVATLISILSSGLEAKLDDMRKGHSLVVEKGHTLILGWSPRIFLILEQLIEANKNAHKPRIVILANKDKIEMEEAINSRISNKHNSKIICRSGSPIDLSNLDIANPQNSRSIIILSSKLATDPDAQVVKQILALTNGPDRRREPYHIVAELVSTDNLEAAKMVGGDEVEVVIAEDLISRITVQTSLQTGLSIVYRELLDFDGDEIYIHKEPKLVGKTYREAMLSYDNCSVIGMVGSDKKVRLNPPNGTIFSQNDSVIAIAEDDDSIKLSGRERGESGQIVVRSKPAAELDKILILGWNSKGRTIVRELDHYVLDGSSLTVVSEVPETEKEVAEVIPGLKNLTVEFLSGDTSNRAMLDSMALTTFQHIILLGYDSYDRNEADSKTLMTLLHLRDIESRKGETYSIVSEMFDVRNRELAVIAKADDFIVSDQLAGLLLTQISENKLLSAVFEDLFSADGSEIYLKPATDYVKTGEELNFYTVVEAASRNNESAIGYRIGAYADDPEETFGVRLNPPKDGARKYSNDDMIMVLAKE